MKQRDGLVDNRVEGPPVKVRVTKSLTLSAVALAATLSLAACSGGGQNASTQSEGAQSAAQSSDASASGGSGQSFKIGITQILSHPSLDRARDGFKQAFTDAGIDVTYDEKNANGDQSTAASIAGTFASGNDDLILAIATPTAQAAAQAISDKPIVFTAVTDPVDAGLVASLQAPGGNITGTTDANPVEKQLQLIKDLVPGAKTIGIVYSPGEANSVVQVKWAKTAADKLGLEIVEAPAVTSADVLQATESLDVDAIYVPTDNVVVSALETVLQVGEQKKIPVFGAEGDSVARGTVATYGLDYFQLGYQTGQMAIKILTEGADPATMPVETISEPSLYINKGAAERMGVTIPADLLAQADPKNITE